MIKSILLTICCLFALSVSHAWASDNTRGNLWSVKFDDDIANAKMSPDGKHILVYLEDSLLCLNTLNGNREWIRTYDKIYPFQHLLTLFVNNNECVIPGKDRILFMDVNNGKELASLPIIGDMSDISFELPIKDTDLDTLQPIQYGDVLVVWYGDGTQVIDLIDRKVIYQSEDDPSKLKIERWFSTMMLYTESDTTIFIDGTLRKIVYLHDGTENPLSEDIYQRFFEHKDILCAFTETNIAVVDKRTAKKIGSILVNPEETLNHFPIVKDDKLYFFASLDERHELYDVATQKRLWSISRQELPGIVDQVTITSNGGVLVHWYDEGDNVQIANVDFVSGKIAWSTKLLDQDGAYEAGHIKPSTALATIASTVAATLLNAAASRQHPTTRPFYSTGPGGILRYNGRSMFSTIDKANLGNETMNGLTAQKINKKRSSEGLFKVVGVDGDVVHLITMGTVRKAWDGNSSGKQDGEGLVTMNLKTGKVVNFKPVSIIADNEKDDFNLFMHGETSETNHGLLVIGSKNILHATNKGELSIINFPTKDITKLQTKPEYLVVYFEGDDEKHNQWYIDCSKPALSKTLMVLADERCAGVTPDTTVLTKTLTWFDNTLTAYSPLTEYPSSSTKPLWVLPSSEVEKLDIGSLDADTVIVQKQGLRVYKDNVFLLGDDGLAVIDHATGKCVTSGQWSPAFKIKRDGLVFLADAAAYQSDKEVGMVSVKNPCKANIVCKEEVNHIECTMLVDKETSTVIIANYDDGTLNAYAP